MRRRIVLAGVITLVVGGILALAVLVTPKSTVSVQTGTATLETTPLPVLAAVKLPKKLIEYGWDVPSPGFVTANIRAMEQHPFDGVVVRLTVGPNIFTHTAYAETRFTQDRSDLKATTFTRFTDNFLLVWSSSEQEWNFLSDSDWSAAEQNTRNFARTAAAGGFKGIFFDTETYGQNTWAYNTTIYPNTTFEQLQAIVRQRGASFMSALQGELPGARVLSTWFLGKLQDDYNATGGNLVNSGTPLFGAFIEGMFSTVTGDARLIEGNEASYHYTDAAAFDQSRSHLLDAINRLAPGYQAAAHTHTLIGQAIYTDEILNLLNSPRVSSFYIGNQQDRLLLLEHNVYHALRTSDEYVWFYSEKVDWWKKPSIPAGVEDAIRHAQAALASGQAPTYDMRFLDTANKALAQAVDVYGKVTTTDGAPIQHVVIQSGFHNLSDVESACYTDQNNSFDCKLPNGWSGTLTPALKGYQFAPPALIINTLTSSYSVNFTAIPVESATASK